MSSIKWAAPVLAALSLLGCQGSQPSIYRVAVDRLGTENMPPSCYRAGNAPTTIADKSTNLIDEKQWVIWEGIEDKFYLEPGPINYQLAEARSITVSADAIVGTKTDSGTHEFVTDRTQTVSANEVYTTSAKYTFEELGKTIKGTLALHSQCAGSACNSTPTCDITLNFSGIQINGDRNIDYGSGSGG
jgi:hypothetical protein